MIYPVILWNNANYFYTIEIMDDEIPREDNPILTFNEIPKYELGIFTVLFAAFHNQYNLGFNEGYNQALEDLNTVL